LRVFVVVFPPTSDPKSRPGAVKSCRLLKSPTLSDPGPAGNARSTGTGTENCPVSTGARQTKLTVTDFPPIIAEESPLMVTYAPAAAPPFQVTVIPCVRFTAVIWAWLAQIKAVGRFNVALKCCISLPPTPLSKVNDPPVVGMKVDEMVEGE
jgi:hypothetical protein